MTDAHPSGATEMAAQSPIRLQPRDFRTDEPLVSGAPEVFDLLGRDRHLFYGPYLELEPGVWRAKVELELFDSAAKRRLAIEFGVQPDFTTVDLPYHAEGPIEIEVDNAIRAGGLTQIRLWLRRAAATGRVRFGGVTLRKVGELGETVAPAASRSAS